MQLSTKSTIHLSIAILTVVIVISGTAHAQYNQFFGASNYFGGGLGNQGYWYVQTRCPWGTAGYRSPSTFQCGTYTCPSMWYGTTTYSCPVGSIYSNSLQTCVNPAALTTNCRRRVG